MTVKQIILPLKGLNVDEEGDIVLWFEVPYGATIEAIDKRDTVTDTSVQDGEPGVDFRVTL